MFGLPAAATKVGNQSRPDTMAFSTLPAGTLPGQRMIAGTRKPPSSAVPFPPANGVLPPSGHVKFSVPLSVEKARIVLFASPLSLRYFTTEPTTSSSCSGFLDAPAVLWRAHVLVLLGEVRDDM